MTRPVINVAAVSYLNTIPFCEADIALVPAGGLPLIKDPDFDVVTSWCIGAEGPVRTVVMVSGAPLKAIKKVWLDGDSHTSVELARLLASKYWKIAPEWAPLDDPARLAAPGEGDAFVLIGDKVFDNEGRFAHSWDLADEWAKYSKLPFVFAVWVARKSVPAETLAALENALTLGVERIYESILESPYADRPYAYEYLTRNIDYFFDEQKRRGLGRFWDEGLKAPLRANPG